MSVFYGTVRGQRGPATRCGSTNSGVQTAAQSWDGSVVVKLSYRNNDPDDALLVSINTANGSSPDGLPAWNGTFDEFKKMLEEDKWRRRHSRY